MTKVRITADADETVKKQRYMKFTPVVSMGNILTAIAIICGAVTAWVQLNGQVVRLANETAVVSVTLATENNARKAEIKDTIARQDVDRADLYKKIASDHAETQAQIKAAQQTTHDDLKEISTSIGSRFDRIEDKLEKKADKR